MAREAANRLEKIASELADVASVLFDGLLLPAIGDCPEQRNQGGGAGRDHLSLDTVLDEGRVLLERRTEEHLARQEHDHELRAAREIGKVVLGAEL